MGYNSGNGEYHMIQRDMLHLHPIQCGLHLKLLRVGNCFRVHQSRANRSESIEALTVAELSGDGLRMSSCHVVGCRVTKHILQSFLIRNIVTCFSQNNAQFNLEIGVWDEAWDDYGRRLVVEC